MYADVTTLHGTYDTFQNTDNTDILTITLTINKELLLIVTYTKQISYK